MSFCSKCGSEIQSGVAFCPNCGNAVANSTAGSNNTAPKKSKKQIIGLAACLAVLAIVITVVVSIVSKMNSDGYEEVVVNTDFTEPIAVVLNDDLTEKDDNKPENDPINAKLSPEEAVEIYMANKSVWMLNPEYMPMQGYAYCLLDLDFDGILELITSANDGSGRYSYNSYYRIVTETQTVEEISLPDNEGEGGYDYFYMADYVKLFKNSAENKLFYYCADYLRVMTGEYGTYYGTIFLDDKVLQTNYLFSEYHCEAGLEGNNEEIHKYEYFDVNDWIEISDIQYNQKTEKYFDENTDMNLEWTSVSGHEFDNSNDDKQRELLLDAYRCFSYDGFSFPATTESETSFSLKGNDLLTVTGTLSREDYVINSNNKGTVTILNLSESISCNYYDDFMGYNGEQYTVDSVQISLESGEYELYKDKIVTVSGNVLFGHTGHHRRDIVLLNCQIVPQNGPTKMTDFLGKTLQEIGEMYGSDYRIIDNSQKGGFDSDYSIYYDDKRASFIFGIDSEQEPNDKSVINWVTYSSTYKEFDCQVDDDIISNSTFDELKKLKEITLWDEMGLVYYATYKDGDISVDFEYQEPPESDTKAHSIRVAKRSRDPLSWSNAD